LVIVVLAALTAVLPGAARAVDAARGKELFELCSQCHGETGAGNPLYLAPSIAGLGEWYLQGQLKNFKTGVRGMHPEDTAGLRMYPMSQTLKTEEDIQTLASYVASLPAPPVTPTLAGGDATRGAKLYQVCAACHGPDGNGNQAVGSPRLTGQSDWYMLSSLQKFKAGIRGTYPNAAIMRGMAATLPDEQAMRDVIAYIQTLSSQTAANTK
jgi:cbb3-type cytochrome c oxidase subunit III